jgi:hypothetical protein
MQTDNVERELTIMALVVGVIAIPALTWVLMILLK